VKFLLDENQSPALVELIAAAGHDVVHARDVGLRSAPDAAVLESAARSGRVLISGDTDFGELLATSNAALPSVVLFRRQGQRRAREVSALLLMNLATVAADLETGAVVVFDDDRIRVRALPIRP
jgi:predicted nuclease of predicted toxin-antitoxin system